MERILSRGTMTDIQEQAKALRQQGNTYKQIVSLLNGGVSVDWCKRNLKTVAKEDNTTLITQEIAKLANRDVGVTNYEIIGVLHSFYTEEEVKKMRKDKQMLTKIKGRVRTVNHFAIFRPAWMDTDSPKDSLKYMTSTAHTLFENMQDILNDYMSAFPNVHRMSAQQEMVKLANSWLIPEDIETRCERNSKVAANLEERKAKKQ